jgi:hypothetical protein
VNIPFCCHFVNNFLSFFYFFVQYIVLNGYFLLDISFPSALPHAGRRQVPRAYGRKGIICLLAAPRLFMAE